MLERDIGGTHFLQYNEHMKIPFEKNDKISDAAKDLAWGWAIIAGLERVYNGYRIWIYVARPLNSESLGISKGGIMEGHVLQSANDKAYLR